MWQWEILQHHRLYQVFWLPTWPRGRLYGCTKLYILSKRFIQTLFRLWGVPFLSRWWYQLKTGQTSCLECPEGYYCPWPNSEPVPCEKEQICPPGSSAPKEDCKGLMTLNNETEECEMSSIVYALIAVSLAVVVAAIGFVILRKYRRNNETRQRLLERQHPVYTGWWIWKFTARQERSFYSMVELLAYCTLCSLGMGNVAREAPRSSNE